MCGGFGIARDKNCQLSLLLFGNLVKVIVWIHCGKNTAKMGVAR
jgi:hypothetical protein